MLWGGNLAGFGSLERKQTELPRLERENGTNPRLLKKVHQSLGGIKGENQMREEGKHWRMVFYILSHLPPEFSAL